MVLQKSAPGRANVSAIALAKEEAKRRRQSGSTVRQRILRFGSRTVSLERLTTLTRVEGLLGLQHAIDSHRASVSS
jgi:hypothetical protein